MRHNDNIIVGLRNAPVRFEEGPPNIMSNCNLDFVEINRKEAQIILENIDVIAKWYHTGKV